MIEVNSIARMNRSVRTSTEFGSAVSNPSPVGSPRIELLITASSTVSMLRISWDFVSARVICCSISM
jgi:hypothetical protein